MVPKCTQRILATASEDKLVLLSRTADGSTLAALPQPGVPTAVAFSRKGTLLAVAMDTNMVAVWDMLGDLARPLLLPPQKGEVSVGGVKWPGADGSSAWCGT